MRAQTQSLSKSRSILVLRPAHECRALRAALADWQVYNVPGYRIEWLKPAMSRADWQWATRVVITSPNAVRGLRRQWTTPPWPTSCGVHAPGSGTATALRRFGVGQLHTPALGASIQALLQTDHWQTLKGERVLIVGAPSALSEWLQVMQQRGAEVQVLALYRRSTPRWQNAHAQTIKTVLRQRIPTLVSSLEAFQQVHETLTSNQRVQWLKAPMLVTSERLAKALDAWGCTRLHRIKSAQTKDVVEALRSGGWRR